MSEALKIRWVGLVRPDDPEYLAAMSAQALAHRRIGPRQDPGEIYRASSLAETAVRAWLGARLPLLEERVVVADLLPHGKRAHERPYPELPPRASSWSRRPEAAWRWTSSGSGACDSWRPMSSATATGRGRRSSSSRWRRRPAISARPRGAPPG